MAKVYNEYMPKNVEELMTKDHDEWKLKVVYQLMPKMVYDLTLKIYDFFLFQAEDGIRDATVTGVQTCALPILSTKFLPEPSCVARIWTALGCHEIGRASCRESVDLGGRRIIKKKINNKHC